MLDGKEILWIIRSIVSDWPFETQIAEGRFRNFDVKNESQHPKQLQLCEKKRKAVLIHRSKGTPPLKRFLWLESSLP